MDDRSYNRSSKRELIERLAALQQIAVDLLKERDPHNLLELIVSRAMKLLLGDSGSLYLTNRKGELVFEVALNESIDLNLESTVLDEGEHGIAHYSFTHNKTLNIIDVYEIDESLPYHFNQKFDIQHNYRTKSMLCCSLTSSKGEVFGVIQIMNRKYGPYELWPLNSEKRLAEMPHFSNEDEELLESFASLASAAIENSRLNRDIQNLLDGFVRASVNAIESRDLATSGHSERVAILTNSLAVTLSKSQVLEAKNINFSSEQLKELKYASLLHDFGKIGVKESILLKAEKLYPEQKMAIEARLMEYGHVTEIRHLRGMLEKLAKEEKKISPLELAREYKIVKNLRSEIEQCWTEILEINKTSVITEDKSKKLEKICSHKFHLLDGKQHPVLNHEEKKYLSIKKGSLTDEERDAINTHVSMTFKFLEQIPWTNEYKNLTKIAYAHHEKLDGTGYPLGLKEKQIPVQSKIMAITDIFDALVAMDRPYKKAVPFEKALDILNAEAKDGKLDKFFLKVFIEAKIYLRKDFIEIIQHPKRKAA
jgi:HD-GYP domain-containing protein (c-di-GMP phosphodiesterase class II)